MEIFLVAFKIRVAKRRDASERQRARLSCWRIKFISLSLSLSLSIFRANFTRIAGSERSRANKSPVSWQVKTRVNASFERDLTNARRITRNWNFGEQPVRRRCLPWRVHRLEARGVGLRAFRARKSTNSRENRTPSWKTSENVPRLSNSTTPSAVV